MDCRDRSVCVPLSRPSRVPHVAPAWSVVMRAADVRSEVRGSPGGGSCGVARGGCRVGSSWVGNADEEVHMKARVSSIQATARATNLAGRSGRGVGLTVHHPRKGVEGASCQGHRPLVGRAMGFHCRWGGLEASSRASRWAVGARRVGGKPAASRTRVPSAWSDVAGESWGASCRGVGWCGWSVDF